jgi:hypothetical protein
VVQPTSSDPEGGDVVASGVPTIDKDPYSTEYLINPYPFHEELREAGSVVWLQPTACGRRGATSTFATYSPTGKPSCPGPAWG